MITFPLHNPYVIVIMLCAGVGGWLLWLTQGSLVSVVDQIIPNKTCDNKCVFIYTTLKCLGVMRGLSAWYMHTWH